MRRVPRKGNPMFTFALADKAAAAPAEEAGDA